MKKINILCFGDSLTDGYAKWGLSYTPYARAMEEELVTAWPDIEFNIEVNGLSGDSVIPAYGDFLERIEVCCRTTRKKYDWIIILGGTNDLGTGAGAGELFAALEEVYRVAFNHGSQVLALTIPECAAKLIDLDMNRNAVNNMIKKYGDGNKMFHVLDLKTLMPYHSLSKERRVEIWDDSLHFTEQGYDIIGNHVGKKLAELLGNSVEVPELAVAVEEDENEIHPSPEPWKPKMLNSISSSSSGEN